MKTLTVKELIEKLSEFKNDKLRVVIASDEEGNSFGSIDKMYSFELLKKDILCIYPTETVCDEDEI